MKKEKSEFKFQLNCDSSIANNLMQSYLQANGFSPYEKDGEKYFRAGDQMVGYRGITYVFQGQILIINAWLDGAFGKKFPIEQNSLNMMAMNYRNSLSTLFQEIENLNGGNIMNNNFNNQMNFDPNTGQPINQNYQQPPQNQFSQTFKNETQKKQETMCEIGFWLSILGLLGSFAGIMMGLFVYIMDFYFASQGLKTRKRGKAIATIVLSIISLVIVIFQIIMVNA